MYSVDRFAAHLKPKSFGEESEALTAEEVARRGKRLEDAGLGGTFLGRANDWSGRVVSRRDGLTNSLLADAQSALGGIGGSA